jgi:hypothetical protein
MRQIARSQHDPNCFYRSSEYFEMLISFKFFHGCTEPHTETERLHTCFPNNRQKKKHDAPVNVLKSWNSQDIIVSGSWDRTVKVKLLHLV